MVDLASLKSMLSHRSSLLDYMGNGKTNVFDGLAQSNSARINRLQELAATPLETGSKSISVSLSAEAQKILSDGAPADGSLSGVQKGAQNFVMSFFDQSGIDLSGLSAETRELIRGFQDVIAGIGTAVTRDITTDMMEERHQDGKRQVYTMVGDGSRLRLTIDYDATGKPQKLGITDILKGDVEIAEISLSAKDGKPDSVTVERSQRIYANGSLVDSLTKPPLSLNLYAAA